MNKFEFTIICRQHHTGPYEYDKVGAVLVKQRHDHTYITDDLTQALKIIKDELDAPDSLLTIESVRSDWQMNLPDDACKRVMDYYNFRHEEYDKCREYLSDKINEESILKFTYSIDIPEKYFSFYVNDYDIINDIVELNEIVISVRRI